MGCDMCFELGHEQRGALGASAFVPDRILDFDLVENGSIVQFNEKRVRDRALGGIMIIHTVLLLLDAMNLRTESIDARVCSGCVAVRLRRKFAMNQGEGDHVIDIVAVERECYQHRKTGT